MFSQFAFGREFFATLEAIDRKIAGEVGASRCRRCGGPLHRGDYDRKPRGAVFAPEGETFVVRFSFCCGAEGCRKRATPPSLRFLGRRVYLGAVVLVASVLAQALTQAAEIRTATGVPARTVRRWLDWWRGGFLSTAVFVALRARLVGLAVDQIPAAILTALPGAIEEQVRAMLRLLCPLSTTSVREGAGLSRVTA